MLKSGSFLKKGKAKVVKREPFTIQLLYETTKYTQPLTMGIDPGYRTIGISVLSKDKEVYCSETEIRTDVKEKLEERREYRCSRRTRKLRHRKPRFNNRKKSKRKGWLPPTIEQKLESHLNEINFVLGILPVSRINLEINNFDIQKINNPEIEEKGYQEGPLKGYSSHLREFILTRDGHECQCCHGKSGEKILEVHHILPRPVGTNRQDNLITLCRTCHRKIHEGKAELKVKPAKRNIPETQMNIMRYRLFDRIKEIFDGEVVKTYGADTKSYGIEMGYKKSHAIDALMISGNTEAIPMDMVYKRRKHRAHNRQIHRAKFIKGHVRRRA